MTGNIVLLFHSRVSILWTMAVQNAPARWTIRLVSKRMSKYVFTRGCESIRMLLLIDFFKSEMAVFQSVKINQKLKTEINLLDLLLNNLTFFGKRMDSHEIASPSIPGNRSL